MNNKWIVPIVAILLCAVSLIGAGYAAITATLTDNETADVENNYVELAIGDNDITDAIDIDYQTAAVYKAGAFQSITYTPQSTGTGASAEAVMTFVVSKTEVNDGASNSYGLTISNFAVKNAGSTAATLTATVTSLAIYDSDDNLVANPSSGLEYDEKYTMYFTYASSAADVLKYAISGADPALAGATTVDDFADAQATAIAAMAKTITFTLNVTATID